jgi:murein DD-endopeptidase MepM/ murein hydrolase activator NlpD
MRRTLIILAVLLTLLPVTASVAYAKPSEWNVICNHVVKSGETVYCIARAYGVDPSAIAAQNGLVNPNLIYPGQTLAIPDAYASIPAGPTCAAQCPAAPSCTCASYHLIITGENLYRISLKYGVSMWRIAECNGIYNLNYIRAGDTLCIPNP